MEYSKEYVSNIEKATNNNSQKIKLEKILKEIGFTEKEIELNFSIRSNKTCSFH